MSDPILVRMALDALMLDQRAQPRTGVDLEVVSEYVEALRRGDTFPPGDAFGTTAHAFLASGWHRYYAHKSAGLDAMDVVLHDGGIDDAIWFSCGTNTDHGLRRSNRDKRRSVENALGARPGLSDREIARHCGVSHHTVAATRGALSGQFAQIEQRVVERNGTTYVQDTSNIGGRPLASDQANDVATALPSVPGVPLIPPSPDIVPPEERSYYALSRQCLVVRLRPEDVAGVATDPESALVGFEEFERWLREFVAALKARVEQPIRAVK